MRAVRSAPLLATAALAALAVAALAALAALAGPASAQDPVPALAAACAAGETALEGPCLETVLAARAAQGLIGVAASGGPALPGSSSTLGKRFDGPPRFAVTVRGGLARASVPDALGPVSGPAPDAGATAPTLQVTAAAGVFDGFSLAPTVGGVLSVDALATGSWVRLPSDPGYRDSARGVGLGVRVGILRESFTLPGVTFSATRRWMGQVRLAEDGPEGTRADVDLTATSYRLTVGKGLAALDVLGGLGWERYGGEVDLRVRPTGADGPEGRTSTSGFTSDRTLFYAGAGYTFLVYQLSAEAGYARGFDGVPDRPGGGYDPTSGSFFVRLGVRLTL